MTMSHSLSKRVLPESVGAERKCFRFGCSFSAWLQGYPSCCESCLQGRIVCTCFSTYRLYGTLYGFEVSLLLVANALASQWPEVRTCACWGLVLVVSFVGCVFLVGGNGQVFSCHAFLISRVVCLLEYGLPVLFLRPFRVLTLLCSLPLQLRVVTAA